MMKKGAELVITGRKVCDVDLQVVSLPQRRENRDM